jgi:light-regulated signal transduction histidine kinase (bacteriophytochrome)
VQLRLATIQDSLSDQSRDVEASHLSPTCNGSRAQDRYASPKKPVVSSADQPEAYRKPHVKPAKPDVRHLASNGHESDPLQLPQDAISYTSQAIQGFGLLFVLEFTGKSSSIPVQAVSENSKVLIGKTPSELLSLESFTSIIKDTQVDEFVEQIDLIQSRQTDIVANRFEAFTVSMSISKDHFREFWCVMHQTDAHSSSIICEFELHEDEHTVGCEGHSILHPPGYKMAGTAPPKKSAKTMQSQKRPSRGRCNGEKRSCNSVAMDTLNTLSRVQDRLATASDIKSLLEVAVDIAKDLTGFHRVMIYQFDQDFNARVVTEHADTKATTGAYLGRTFAASEFTRESRESHRLNKLRMLYDRDFGSARLVCSASKAIHHPLDLTSSYLRAMSYDRLRSLATLAVRSSVSISINASNKLWGLVVCHSYGLDAMRVSFPIRRICYLLSDMVSREIEKFSYVSQLRAKDLVNTLPTSRNPYRCPGSSLEPLLKILRADFGILSVRNTTQVFGPVEQPQEALIVLAYLRKKTVTSVFISTNVKIDLLDLRCPFDLRSLGGVLVVPLSNEAKDFVVFFRKPHFKGLERANNPDVALINEGMEDHSEFQKNSGARSETVIGCQNWTEEEVQVASVFAFVYAKLIAIWGYDEAALQSSRLTQLLLANTAHEIRTPLNAVINYLELALEGSLDNGTRKKLEKSQRASKSLLHFVHELLKLITGNKVRSLEVASLESMNRRAP